MKFDEEMAGKFWWFTMCCLLFLASACLLSLSVYVIVEGYLWLIHI